MFPNKNYKRDIENIFAINRFFSRMVGMWPLTHKNSRLLELMESCVLVIACYVVLLSEIIPAVLYMILKATNIRAKMRIVGSTIFSIMGTFKYSFMLLYKSQMRNCLILIDEDWRNVVNPNDRISMLNKARFAKRLIAFTAAIVYTSGLAFRMVVPLSVGKIVTPQNITIRPLPTQAYLVVLDVQRSPVYEITYFFQCLSGLCKYTIVIATFGFMALCVMHFSAQSDVLITLMNDFVNENRSENLDKKLSAVVRHHIKIKNFLQLVQNVMQYPSLMEVMGSVITLCFGGYYIITEWENHNIIGTVSFIVVLSMVSFNIFIYSYMGDQVVDQGEKIALTTCTLEWHHLPNKKAQALILIIIISEIPLKLKAGNIVDLSLITFSNVVKMAVTYLNLLRTFD